MPNYNEQEMRLLASVMNNPTQKNILPIPMNENNMPMFATDAEYMQYLNEYDPEMFMQMQNEFYNTRGSMGEGRINPLNFIKGLLGD